MAVESQYISSCCKSVHADRMISVSVWNVLSYAFDLKSDWLKMRVRRPLTSAIFWQTSVVLLMVARWNCPTSIQQTFNTERTRAHIRWWSWLRRCVCKFHGGWVPLSSWIVCRVAICVVVTFNHIRQSSSVRWRVHCRRENIWCYRAVVTWPGWWITHRGWHYIDLANVFLCASRHAHVLRRFHLTCRCSFQTFQFSTSFLSKSLFLLEFEFFGWYWITAACQWQGVMCWSTWSLLGVLSLAPFSASVLKPHLHTSLQHHYQSVKRKHFIETRAGKAEFLNTKHKHSFIHSLHWPTHDLSLYLACSVIVIFLS